ncbi:MAG: hypothetical protein J6Y43_02140 [Clostridia bacterium]|nr:hypothetical protein [Clostridia bacterium]
MTIKKTITATEGTFDGKLALEAVLTIAQDALTYYFGTIGVDNASMRKKFNSVWVVAKNKATIYYRPFWNETVKISCSFINVGKITCYCLTEMRSSSDKLLFSVLSELCVVHLEDFRLMPIDSLSLPIEENVKISKSDFVFTKPDDYNTEKNVTVSPLLTDFSNHMNNAKLLFPVVDNLSKETLSKIYEGVFDIIVHYKKQAMSGEKTTFYLSEKDGDVFFEYRLSEGSTASFGRITKRI